jgi:purine catabolism regulator
VLLALERTRPRPDAVAAFAAAVHAGSESRTGIRIGVGPGVRELREVPRAFAEARQVTEAATALQDDRLFHELPDVGLRGLLHLLRDDVRLQTFVERELGALLSYDEQHRAGLRQALQALLDAGGNKSLAAARAAVSRPALYHRLRTIERVLGVDLDSPEVRLSLHVALLGYDATAGRVSAPSAPRAAPARRRRPASAR